MTPRGTLPAVCIGVGDVVDLGHGPQRVTAAERPGLGQRRLTTEDDVSADLGAGVPVTVYDLAPR